jgi:hypothetical protein
LAREKLVQVFQRASLLLIIDDVVVVVDFENGGITALDFDELFGFQLVGQDLEYFVAFLVVFFVPDGHFFGNANGALWQILLHGCQEFFPRPFQVLAIVAPRSV